MNAPTAGRRATLARLGALTCLVAACRAGGAFAGPAADAVADWVDRADRLGGALRGAEISVDDWRRGLDDILGRVALEDVMREIDFARLARRSGFAEVGVSVATVRFGEGLRRLSFAAKVFAVGQGRAIVPHGHANMVSAHLPLSGRFRLRQYDQVGRNRDGLLLRPSADRIVGPGDLSSVGEGSDNVHWFLAEAPSHTFDVIVTGLDPVAERRYEIFNVDIESARVAGGGLMRAPYMSVEAALRKYG